MKERKIKAIDILWMDIQGSELMALRGLGGEISNVNIIHTEVEFFEIYKNQPLFHDLFSYLIKKGFLFSHFTNLGEYAGDAIFINHRKVSVSQAPRLLLKNFLILVGASPKKIDNLGRTKNKMTISLFAPVRLLKRKYHNVYDKVRQLSVKGNFMLSLRRFLTYSVLKFKDYFGADKTVRLGDGYKQSEYKIDVIIPVTSKDYSVLEYTIDSLNKYLAHDIDTIYLVAKKDDFVSSLSRKLKLRLIDESSLDLVKKNQINYVYKGIDRSGWLFQQLIKLSADNISNKEFVMVIDADTILTKKQRLIIDGKIAFNHSYEYNKPYFETYAKLFGVSSFNQYPLSYISHYMMLNTSILKQMKLAIEASTGVRWDQAIVQLTDKTTISGFSEYETYGNYYRSKKRSYNYWWNNVSLANKKYDEESLDNLGNKIKSVSYHVYEKID